MTALKFRSRFGSKSHYDVTGGPMDGKTVTLFDSDRDEIERTWCGGSNWNITRAEFERDLLGGAGLLVQGHKAVTPDVLRAYRDMALKELEKARVFATTHRIDGMDDAYFEARTNEVLAVETGHWDRGWHRGDEGSLAKAA